MEISTNVEVFVNIRLTEREAYTLLGMLQNPAGDVMSPGFREDEAVENIRINMFELLKTRLGMTTGK